MFNEHNFNQFKEVFKKIQPNIKELSFCKNKKIVRAKHDKEYSTYRKYVECRDKISLHYGFGYNKKGAWYYIAFLIDKEAYSNSEETASNIEKQLQGYKFDKDMPNHYRVVVSEIMKDWTTGNSISIKEISNWFSQHIKIIKEAKDTDIQTIINAAQSL